MKSSNRGELGEGGGGVPPDGGKPLDAELAGTRGDRGGRPTERRGFAPPYGGANTERQCDGGRGGTNKEDIVMTMYGFKQLCMALAWHA